MSLKARLLRIASRIRIAVPNLNDPAWKAIKAKGEAIMKIHQEIESWYESFHINDPKAARKDFETLKDLLSGYVEEFKQLARFIQDNVSKINWVIEYETAFRGIVERLEDLVSIAREVSKTYFVAHQFAFDAVHNSSNLNALPLKAIIDFSDRCGVFAIRVETVERRLDSIYEQIAPSEFSYSGFKVINKYGVLKKDLELLLSAIDQAARQLKRAGFGKLLYGPFVIKLNYDKMKDATGAGNAGGYYDPRYDHFVAFVPSNYTRADLVVHELGHRFWFRFLDNSQRQYWEGKYRERGASEELVRRAMSLTYDDRKKIWDAVAPLMKKRQWSKVDNAIEEVVGFVGLTKMADYLMEKFSSETKNAATYSDFLRPFFYEDVEIHESNLKMFFKKIGVKDIDTAYDDVIHGLNPDLPKGWGWMFGGNKNSFSRSLGVKGKKRFIGGMQPYIDTNTKPELLLKWHKKWLGMEDKPTSVSEYGRTNDVEDFAETFTAIVTGDKPVNEETKTRFWRTVNK